MPDQRRLRWNARAPLDWDEPLASLGTADPDLTTQDTYLLSDAEVRLRALQFLTSDEAKEQDLLDAFSVATRPIAGRGKRPMGEVVVNLSTVHDARLLKAVVSHENAPLAWLVGEFSLSKITRAPRGVSMALVENPQWLLLAISGGLGDAAEYIASEMASCDLRREAVYDQFSMRQVYDALVAHYPELIDPDYRGILRLRWKTAFHNLRTDVLDYDAIVEEHFDGEESALRFLVLLVQFVRSAKLTAEAQAREDTWKSMARALIAPEHLAFQRLSDLTGL